MSKPTDAGLIAAFQAGDADAFETIYRRYDGLLRWTAWKQCGDWHLAEDICSEAWLTAWKYIPHGNIYRLDSYLVLLVKQRWWLLATQARRRPELEPFDPLGRYHGQIGFVEDLACEHETIQEVTQLLDCLPDEDRVVATLKLLYGYDLPDAAEALGRGRSGVSAAWRRCQRKFTAWAGTKARYDALDQALILARYPDQAPIENQCRVPGCARPRHAYERCEYHAEGMLARRRQLAAKRCTA